MQALADPSQKNLLQSIWVWNVPKIPPTSEDKFFFLSRKGTNKNILRFLQQYFPKGLKTKFTLATLSDLQVKLDFTLYLGGSRTLLEAKQKVQLYICQWLFPLNYKQTFNANSIQQYYW